MAAFYLPRSTQRLLPSVLAGLLVASSVWLVGGAQQPPRKPAVAGEDPKVTKPAPKGPPVEEEDPNAGKPRKPPIILIDDDPKASTPKPAPAAEPVDILTAARKEKNPLLREFYNKVRVPHDRILDRNGRYQDVAPLHAYVGNDPSRLHGNLKIQPLNVDFQPGTPGEIAPSFIRRVEAYEEVVEIEVDDLFKRRLAARPGGDDDVPNERLIQAAETALGAAYEFHQDAWKDGRRVGQEWLPIKEHLRARLLETRLLPVATAVEPADWKAVIALARNLAGAYKLPDERKAIARRLADRLEQVLKERPSTDAHLLEFAEQMRSLEDVLPAGVASRPVEDRLRERAEKLFQQARDYEQAGRPQDALEALNAAAKLWPRLPGLQDLRLHQLDAFQVLRVGVRSLPRYVVPGLACTDAERQAVELVFESLVRPRQVADIGTRYVPILAAGQPRLVPAGRQFQLRPQLFWSNGNQVTALDVQNTVRLLKDPRWPGFNAALAEQLADPPTGTDTQRVVLSLRQSSFDPLALLTFKIVPHEVSADAARDFRDNPVGTGPYQFRGLQKTRDNVEYARFVANPNYSAREGKEGLPRIREVQFLVTADPVADLHDNKIDLCLDFPANGLADLQKKAPQFKALPLPAGRRVYFLAVNQQKQHSKLRNADLRRALALSINRGELLDYFRSAKGDAIHHVLRGPYPVDSWACDPSAASTVADPLFNTYQAKVCLEAARRDGLPGRKLAFLYPDDDPRVGKAMLKLCDQIKTSLDLDLEPRAVEPHLLRRIVEGTPQVDGRDAPFSYDLAYYSYDFPSETYWLWPLFDPSPAAREAGGGNFLGYLGDSSLEGNFRNAMSQRSFKDVQQTTWATGELIAEHMPLIPLWQLDRYVVIPEGLRTPSDLDPLMLFADIDQWYWKHN